MSMSIEPNDPNSLLLAAKALDRFSTSHPAVFVGTMAAMGVRVESTDPHRPAGCIRFSDGSTLCWMYGNHGDDHRWVANSLQCEFNSTCAAAVSYVDDSGFVYCGAHGRHLQDPMYRKCRKLRPHELRTLLRGNKLASY